MIRPTIRLGSPIRDATFAASALLLAGCATPLTRQARYTGPLAGCGAGPSTLTTQKGTGQPGTGGATGQGAAFAFAPGDGSLLIRGAVAADGGFAGSLDTQPPGKPPYLLTVAGRLTADAAEVTFTRPGCQVAGRLVRVRATLLP